MGPRHLQIPLVVSAHCLLWRRSRLWPGCLFAFASNEHECVVCRVQPKHGRDNHPAAHWRRSPRPALRGRRRRRRRGRRNGQINHAVTACHKSVSWSLQAVDTGDPGADPSGKQTFPHLLAHGTMRSLRHIRHAHLCRVQPRRRAQGRDDARHTLPVGCRHHGHFVGDLVCAIDHHIQWPKLRQNSVYRGFIGGRGIGHHFTIRVDLTNALCQHLHFVPPDGARQSGNLLRTVADFHQSRVHEHQKAYSSSS